MLFGCSHVCSSFLFVMTIPCLFANSSWGLMLDGLVYWATRLHLEGFVNKVLYLGYLSLVAIIAFMVTGSIGFLSCYAFLRVI